MKTRRAFPLLLLCLFAHDIFPQLSLAFRFELQNNYHSVSDPGNQLQNIVNKSLGNGLDIVYERKKWLLLSGLGTKLFSNRIQFSTTFAGAPTHPALQVPILLGRKINLFKNKLSICPLFGTNFLYLPGVQSFPFTFTVVTNSASFAVTKSSVLLNKTSFTLAGMLQLNYDITKNFVIGTYVAFSKGFRPILQQKISYVSGTAPPIEANTTDTGTFFSWWALRLQYTI
jgi:hypothetical protein